jgi:hypothetical protein
MQIAPVFTGGVMVLTEGISKSKVWPVDKSVGQVPRIGNFLKFDIDITGIAYRGKTFDINWLGGNLFSGWG